jgi:hypothetical protein
MGERLTKAQVEALLLALADSPERLEVALSDAVEVLTGSRDVAGVLRSRGRGAEAEALSAGDPSVAWALATELNETRTL